MPVVVVITLNLTATLALKPCAVKFTTLVVVVNVTGLLTIVVNVAISHYAGMAS